MQVYEVAFPRRAHEKSLSGEGAVGAGRALLLHLQPHDGFASVLEVAEPLDDAVLTVRRVAQHLHHGTELEVGVKVARVERRRPHVVQLVAGLPAAGPAARPRVGAGAAVRRARRAVEATAAPAARQVAAADARRFAAARVAAVRPLALRAVQRAVRARRARRRVERRADAADDAVHHLHRRVPAQPVLKVFW